ncbi:MAG: hypothetical protein IKZ91_01510 [Bacteroidales bacterium]|nr:hypothetical protein [Bacteroidales bacterium]
MMRRLILIFAFAALVLSCTKETPEWDGPVIELTLETPVDFETKAGYDGTKDGVDRYNENLISTVDFFFYPVYPKQELDSTAVATYHIRRTSGKRRSDVMRLEFTSEQINTIIFPSSPSDCRTVHVLAIVNAPETLVDDESDLTGTSLRELLSRSVTNDFVSPANHKQNNFMMSGSVTMGLRGRSSVVAATGTVKLERYACKMTVSVDVADAIYVGKEVWRPMLAGMEVYLVNGVSDVTLGGEKTEDPTYFSYRNNSMRFAYVDLEENLHFYFEKDGSYYNTYPMYMYPQHWDYGSTLSPHTEPFLKLVVPWVRDEDPANHISATQRQSYYKVVIPDDQREEFRRSFVRNNWYHIKIHVGMLGSETDEATVTADGWCYIVYWQDKDIVIKSAEIGNARYLSVDNDVYMLRNISSAVNLGYTTSHPVEIQNVRVTRPYYGDSTSGPALGGTVKKATASDPYPVNSYYLEYTPDQQRALNDGKDWLTDTGTGITFQHTINNDYTDPLFDYSPYTISYELVHADIPEDQLFRKKITVHQYPAVYIETRTNSDNTVSGTGKPKPNNYTSQHWGYVYIDGEQHFRSEYDSLANAYVQNGETWDLQNNGGGTVRWKPDMQDLQWRVINYTGGSRDFFKMNITVLPENSDFVIGDPRVDEIDNLNPVRQDGVPVPFCTARAFEDPTTTRSLTWYYPADPTERTRNLMAPQYIIATKFGGIEYYDGTPFAEAQYRCASYQEDGYPAGRWRLPTRGEIRFIAMLSANSAFTFLFTTGSYYWSANGAIYVVSGDVQDAPSKTTALARCVYDTWYWGDEQMEDRDIFTWGDKER